MTMMTMPIATEIVHHLRANGFTAADALRRQVLGLAEEAGEFVGAYRRWSGLARRAGTAADMQAELADVVITTYVTAAELGLLLDPPLPPVVPADPDRAVLDVFRAVHGVVTLFGLVPLDHLALGRVLGAAQQAAAALGIDLAAAVAAKLDVIFTRGWRESTPNQQRPRTVPCIWGCGYLARSEMDLDEHEQSCEHQASSEADGPGGEWIVVDPVSRSVRSLRRGGAAR